jgi:hypothetical protein
MIFKKKIEFNFKRLEFILEKVVIALSQNMGFWKSIALGSLHMCEVKLVIS